MKRVANKKTGSPIGGLPADTDIAGRDISVLLPERFGIYMPCTFGTQFNVFSRESSVFRSYPQGGYLRLSILRWADAAFPVHFTGFSIDRFIIHTFREMSTGKIQMFTLDEYFLKSDKLRLFALMSELKVEN